MKIKIGKINWYPIRTINAIAQIIGGLILVWLIVSILEVNAKLLTTLELSEWNLLLKLF